jgi:carboxymethylenebutenolidase
MRLLLSLLLCLALLPALACSDEDYGPEEPGSHTDEEYAEDMAKEHADDSTDPSGAADGELPQEVDGEEVKYARADGLEVSGYYSKPADPAGGDLPGLIVIHEWWGLNDNVRRMTDQLAAQGYRALAVDLYEGQVADSPERAREIMQGVDEERATANLRRAYEYLAGQGADRVGVLGWCFGGGWSLQAALAMPDELDAAVIYYGRLVTDREQLAQLEMPVLGLFGAEDEGIPVESVREFESVMKELDKDVTVQVYEGANHAFANPTGDRYDAEAAEDAWSRTTAFLEQHLHAG